MTVTRQPGAEPVQRPAGDGKETENTRADRRPGRGTPQRAFPKRRHLQQAALDTQGSFKDDKPKPRPSPLFNHDRRDRPCCRPHRPLVLPNRHRTRRLIGEVDSGSRPRFRRRPQQSVGAHRSRSGPVSFIELAGIRLLEESSTACSLRHHTADRCRLVGGPAGLRTPRPPHPPTAATSGSPAAVASGSFHVPAVQHSTVR
jgi:hypothetical protein